MNKLIIGLLIIAAGAGVYFLLSKNNSTETAVIKKELIIGTWKIESYQPATDSLQPKYSYDFQKDGMAVRSVNDSIKTDTVKYEWKKTSQLVIKENTADSTGKVYTVEKLTKDSLQIIGTDSVVVSLTKTK